MFAAPSYKSLTLSEYWKLNQQILHILSEITPCITVKVFGGDILNGNFSQTFWILCEKIRYLVNDDYYYAHITPMICDTIKKYGSVHYLISNFPQIITSAIISYASSIFCASVEKICAIMDNLKIVLEQKLYTQDTVIGKCAIIYNNSENNCSFSSFLSGMLDPDAGDSITSYAVEALSEYIELAASMARCDIKFGHTYPAPFIAKYFNHIIGIDLDYHPTITFVFESTSNAYLGLVTQEVITK